MSRVASSSFLLASCLLASVLVQSGPSQHKQAVAQGISNPIVAENLNTGSDNWKLYLNGHPASDDINRQIQGYPSATSANKGESIAFHMTVSPAQTYTLDIFRLGYYGGLGGRLMAHVGPLDGIAQPDCPLDTTTGLVECAWTPGYTLTIPAAWTTGIYNVIATNQQGYQSLMQFVVRDDSRVADLLYQQPVLTYAAYSNWPAGTLKGKSLYDYNSGGAVTAVGSNRAVKVSLDRPLVSQFGTLDTDFGWEASLVQWLEKTAMTFPTSPTSTRMSMARAC